MSVSDAFDRLVKLVRPEGVSRSIGQAHVPLLELTPRSPDAGAATTDSIVAR